MSAIDLFVARSVREEGERTQAYDDATGRAVIAPVGNLTWGRGFFLERVASTELFDVIERHLVGKIDAQLQQYAWYRNLDEARQSVLLDIAYNAGVAGLLHYPRMLHAIDAHDWTTAGKECDTSDPALKGRYEVLSRILVTGDV